VATLILIGAGLSAIFTLFGIYRRRQRGRRISSAYTMELVFDSIQLGAAVSAGIFPILWLLVSIARNGGTIEAPLSAIHL